MPPGTKNRGETGILAIEEWEASGYNVARSNSTRRQLMARLMALTFVVAALAWSAAASGADEKKASPEPGAKVGQKWEYAELHFSAATGRMVRPIAIGGANPGGKVAPARMANG